MRVSVPGKVLLAGEYAVLLPGAPALVAAIDRRLEVQASPATRWSATSGDARWDEGGEVPEALRFVVAAIEAVRARVPTKPLALVTRDDMHAGGHKLGLGGSAAATVAACAAAAHGSGLDQPEIWRIADEVHRRVQGGRGSGADVAASVHGGVCLYVRDPLSVKSIEVHSEFRLLVVWTGASAKTAPRLERWQAFVEGEPAAARAFGQASTLAVAGLERALVAGDFGLARRSLLQARAVLRGLESRLGLELETPALRTAADVAWSAGACGKLSGAGGGDCAVVLAQGDDGAAKAAAALSDAGLEVVEAPVAKEGVRVEDD